MARPKLLEVINRLSKKEKEHFAQFISNPLFNGEKVCIQLYQYILTHQSPTFKLDNQEIAKHLYPKKTFKNSTVEYVKSTLFQLLKRFLSIQYSQKSNLNTSLLAAYRHLNLSNHYQLEERRIEKKVGQMADLNSNELLMAFQFEKERQDYHTYEKRTETKYLTNMHTYLDAYYIGEKLRTVCITINLSNIYKTEIDHTFLRAILLHVETEELHKSNQFIGIYYYSYLLLTTEEESNYYILKDLVFNSSYTSTEINDAFLFLLNFGIRKINQGEHTFYQEVFDLYLYGIENKVLLEKGKLSAATYSNVVTIGLRLNKLEEVENFVEAKISLLNKSNRMEHYALNRAKILFIKGEFEQVITQFRETKVNELLLEIQMRVLQFKSFFELDEHELCDNLIDSFNQLLKRKDILSYHKDVSKNFIKMGRKLLRLNPHDKKEKEDLKVTISKTTPLMEKEWFLEKVNENR